MLLAERYHSVLNTFAELMPNVDTELHYRNDYELLVAVMLSAQCTDKRVNMVTPGLFDQFPTLASLANSTPSEVFTLISSISYPNSKAKHLVEMAQMVQNQFEGIIPSTREELMKLPGVGRKTANVMLTVYFQKPAMPVDTHVFRVSRRIGLVPQTAKTPDAVEKHLVKHIPKTLLSKAHHWLILHGRYVCKARNPHCTTCSISPYCKKNLSTSFKSN